MDHNNSHNHPQISSDPFEFEPVILDDELLLLINSAVVSPDDNRSGDRTGSITAASNTTTPAPPQEPGVPPQRTEAAAPGKRGNKGKAKSNATRLNATEVERERRHVMSSLYQDLRSLLPPQNVKRRKSISNLLEDAINHINSMQVGINQLNEKKERLSRIRSTPSSSSRNVINNSSNQQKNQVTVKPCKEGIVEITVDTIKNATCNNNNNNNEEEENGLISLPLSKVLQLLSEENLNVINCVSSRVDDSLVHNIQVQVDDGRTVDLGLLQQTLNHRYS